jgi:transposase
MQHIGIDVHKVSSQLCFVDENGEIREKRIRIERKRFREVLGNSPRLKVLIEASTESEWVAQCIEELGHEVIVADPNYAPMYATLNRRADSTSYRRFCRFGLMGKTPNIVNKRH